jgi:hypothetical protein
MARGGEHLEDLFANHIQAMWDKVVRLMVYRLSRLIMQVCDATI